MQWSEIEHGHTMTAFRAAYAIGRVTAGAIIGRLGTKIDLIATFTRFLLETTSSYPHDERTQQPSPTLGQISGNGNTLPRPLSPGIPRAQ